MKVAVLVPRRDDGGHRDRLWQWVRARWETQHPAWAIAEGHHDQGPFNRAAALNNAAELAGDWDVAVIADSDSFVAPDQIIQAVELAESRQRITFAYDRFCYLSHAMTDLVMDGYTGAWWPGVEWTLAGTCSSMVVVTRFMWDTVGGFDEGFVGWGGEDIAFSLACQTFGGGLDRVPGDVWHLWHAPAHHTHDHIWPARLDRYDRVAYDADGMAELLAELHASRRSETEVHA